MLSQKLNYQNIQSYFFLAKTSLSDHFFDLSTIKSLHIISYRFVMLLNTVKQFMTSPEKNYAVHCHMLSSFYFWTFPVKNDDSLHLGCSETLVLTSFSSLLGTCFTYQFHSWRGSSWWCCNSSHKYSKLQQ